MYIHDEYKITNNKIFKVKGGAVDGHMGHLIVTFKVKGGAVDGSLFWLSHSNWRGGDNG